VRDYIHVDDLAQAHLLALDHLRRGGESRKINLGNGEGYSVRQVIEIAREITGQAIPDVTAPRRPGDPSTLVASSALAREVLGWQPRTPGLREIIASAWQWHQAHPQGYTSK
jgi:UDP-glucose 4-epimerase